MTSQEKTFHLQNHKAMAEHCAEMGKCFAKSSDAHAALTKSLEVSDPDASASHEAIADSHKAMAASCAQAGQHHLDACDQLDAMKHDYGTDGSHGNSDLKIILSELQKLTSGRPAGVSAVPRHDAPRLVPRPGQPRQDADREALKAALPEELRDVIFDPKVAIG
jgi:hypothetical protein